MPFFVSFGEELKHKSINIGDYVFTYGYFNPIWSMFVGDSCTETLTHTRLIVLVLGAIVVWRLERMSGHIRFEVCGDFYASRSFFG